MEIAENLGGCPVKDTASLPAGVSPIQDNGRMSTKTFTQCPICDGPLEWGSDEPIEDKTYYWCSGCGIIHAPLYAKPTPKIAPVVDAEELQRVLRSIREEPVPGYVPPSPHSFLDPVLSTPKLDAVKDRLVTDQKIADGQLCDGCPDMGDCWIADEASALHKCNKLMNMRARAMR